MGGVGWGGDGSGLRELKDRELLLASVHRVRRCFVRDDSEFNGTLDDTLISVCLL